MANGGASDTQRLAETVLSLIEKRGLALTVAWVEGDEAIEPVRLLAAKNDGMLSTNITTGKSLKEWGHQPIYAQAYLG